MLRLSAVQAQIRLLRSFREATHYQEASLFALGVEDHKQSALTRRPVEETRTTFTHGTSLAGISSTQAVSLLWRLMMIVIVLVDLRGARLTRFPKF